MTCRVTTTKGTVCKNRECLYKGSGYGYGLCYLHRNIVQKNFENGQIDFWKNYPTEVLIDFAEDFLSNENEMVIKKLITHPGLEMKYKFRKHWTSKTMSKIFFDAFGYESLLWPNVQYYKHVYALELGFNPMKLILQKKTWNINRPDTNMLYEGWFRSAFHFMMYTKAQFLHQKRCGVIVMTTVIHYLYPEILDRFDKTSAENHIMEICLLASNERPGTQCFTRQHGKLPFEKIKGIIQV